MKLLVGLGNPGSTYEETRHNIGFKIIDWLRDELNASKVGNNNFKGELFKARQTLLLKPQTFMNLSGESLLLVKNFYKIPLEDIVVIHDDIEIPFGALRFKQGGGHGGHNGLRSIDSLIGKEYYRMRVGVGRPTNGQNVADYVLGRFSSSEQEKIASLQAHLLDAIFAFENETLALIQSRYTLKG